MKNYPSGMKVKKKEIDMILCYGRIKEVRLLKLKCHEIGWRSI